MRVTEMDSTNLNLIWGAAAIAQAIGRTERQTFHLLESGALPARKIGGRWCVHHTTLIDFFTGKSSSPNGNSNEELKPSDDRDHHSITN